MTLRVDGCYAKLERGAPMTRGAHLTLTPDEGIAGTATAGRHPRQLCLAGAGDLAEQRVKPEGSRANLILNGPGQQLASGDLLTIGDAQLRVTFACEPCAHGAALADSPMRRFRQLNRHLALVITGGVLAEGAPIQRQPGVYPAVPDDFRTRTAWALDHIPAGRVVTSLEFLTAIGASRSYLRALPRWLHAAHAVGKPVHRVVTAGLTAPSWAPSAAGLLVQEGLPPAGWSAAAYPLTDALWFPDLH